MAMKTMLSAQNQGAGRGQINLQR